MDPKSYPRLTKPLVREGDRKTGRLREATWEEALERAARGLERAAARGPEALGFFSCSKSTNEVNYTAQKLARLVLKTNNIDSCNRT